MNTFKKPSNEDKMEYLLRVLDENKRNDPKGQVLYYSINLVRYGATVPVIHRAPAGTNIKEQIIRFSSPYEFNPDYILVDIYTGKSRNVKKPIASYKFDYRTRR